MLPPSKWCSCMQGSKGVNSVAGSRHDQQGLSPCMAKISSVVCLYPYCIVCLCATISNEYNARWLALGVGISNSTSTHLVWLMNVQCKLWIQSSTILLPQEQCYSPMNNKVSYTCCLMNLCLRCSCLKSRQWNIIPSPPWLYLSVAVHGTRGCLCWNRKSRSTICCSIRDRGGLQIQWGVSVNNVWQNNAGWSVPDAL